MRISNVIISALFAFVAFVSGCKERGFQNNTVTDESRILIFHVYDSIFRNYRTYEKVFSESLEKSGIDADIRIIYSSGELNVAQKDAFVEPLERMNRDNWVPNVICFIDDRALSLYLKGVYSEWLPPIDSIPVVAAGLHCPDWTLIRKSSNIAVCTDLLNFTVNLDLVQKMAHLVTVPGMKIYKSVVMVELDTTEYDLRIKDRMKSELDRPPYVNNSDFHIKDYTLAQLSEKYKDSIFIDVFSNGSPEVNQYLSNGNYHRYRRSVLQNLPMTPVLTLKMDIENEQILSKTPKPQFTAIRDGFADGLKRNLCGFFASYETVARDQAEYVERILKGESARSLPIKQHEARFYMDWEAMELLGLAYDDFSEDFTIVGAPWTVVHPYRYGIIVFVTAVLFVALLILVLYLLFRHRDMILADAQKNLEQSKMMMDFALLNANCLIVSSQDELLDLQPRLHPDDTDVLTEILGEIASGQAIHSKSFRMLDADTHEYRWWQFRSGGAIHERGDVSGIVIDIDDSVKYNENMVDAALVAEEITRKETFLMNISHQIRTPLNAILGFAQLLSIDECDIKGDVREEILSLINENSNLLGEMIEDILQFSRFESGRIDVNPQETEIGPLMERIYEQWKTSAPDGLDFMLVSGRAGVFSFVDPMRVETVVGQYVKNAFKFAPCGLVRLGWQYSLTDDTVQLFVEDSGGGIDSRKLKKVFNIFWKDDMFKTGVGLGLTIAKMYTENMGGHVMVESKPGVGSCFSSVFSATIHNPIKKTES